MDADDALELAGPPPGAAEGLEIAFEGERLRIRSGGVERLVATAGEGLWRRAPWPVNDAVFGLGPAGPGAGVLVAGAGRDGLLGKLEATGLAASGAERLTLAGLRGAAVVVMPPFDDRPLPAAAMGVLAARRVLVIGSCSPAFGLEPGLDHLAARTADEAVVCAAAVTAHWKAFAPMRAWGALAAERHRASLLYERLAADLSRG